MVWNYVVLGFERMFDIVSRVIDALLESCKSRFMKIPEEIHADEVNDDPVILEITAAVNRWMWQERWRNIWVCQARYWLTSIPSV